MTQHTDNNRYIGVGNILMTKKNKKIKQKSVFTGGDRSQSDQASVGYLYHGLHNT